MGIFLKGRRRPGGRTVEVELPVGIQWTDPVEFEAADLPLTLSVPEASTGIICVLDVVEEFDEGISVLDGDNRGAVFGFLSTTVGRRHGVLNVQWFGGNDLDPSEVVITAGVEENQPTEGRGVIRFGYFPLAIPG